MQAELFEQLKETYELFDAMRYRVILQREMNNQDAEHSNLHFIKSLCPHLQFRKRSESKTKSYTIKR